MGSNKKDLKVYVRFDGNGRVVASSLVLRRKKPKVGKWMEVQGYQCCDPDFPTSTTTSTTTAAPSDVRLKANIIVTGNVIAGLPEYSWKWNKKAIALGLANASTKGVIAQEALVKYPQHVYFDKQIGYLRVDLTAIAAEA